MHSIAKALSVAAVKFEIAAADACKVVSMHEKIRSYWRDVISRVERLDYPIVKEVIGEVECGDIRYPLYLLTAGSQSCMKMDVQGSAGGHGEEPGGVTAILDFAENDIYDYIDAFNFYLYVCLNAYGYEYDQRYTFDAINTNMDFTLHPRSQEVSIVQRSLKQGPAKYALTFDMHEDNSFIPAEGFTLADSPREFYMYETCKRKDMKIGKYVVGEVEKYAPVCKWPEIYREKNDGGVIWNQTVLEGSDDKTFEGFLAAHYTKHAITTETPTCWDMEMRSKIHRIAFGSALNAARMRFKKAA